MKNKQIVSMAALIAASLSAAHADTITAWNFENLTTATNLAPAASTGVGAASDLGMGIYPTPAAGNNTPDVVLGKSSDTGANGNANTSLTWRVRATGGGNGWSSAAPIGSQGAMFGASTVGYTGISVTFDWYTTTQGEANLQLEYTTDGITFNNVAFSIGANTGISLANNSTSLNTVNGWYGHATAQDWFTGLSANITDPAAANNPNFAIEMVNASTGADNVAAAGTALNNSSGNWRFDNIIISGAVIPAPEPTTLALAGLGGLAALVAVRRRK